VSWSVHVIGVKQGVLAKARGGSMVWGTIEGGPQSTGKMTAGRCVEGLLPRKRALPVVAAGAPALSISHMTTPEPGAESRP
jgi:hypothetical protein